MAKTVYVKAKFEGKAKILKSGGKWIVRRKGTINGSSATRTVVCDNFFAALKEKYMNR